VVAGFAVSIGGRIRGVHRGIAEERLCRNTCSDEIDRTAHDLWLPVKRQLLCAHGSLQDCRPVDSHRQLTGKTVSPGIFEVLLYVGRELSLARVAAAMAFLKQDA
jgi:hypothetical protein